MILARPHGRGWSRRAFIASCSLLPVVAASRRGRVFRSESGIYEDPATEFEVTRLTNPAYACYLPCPDYRFVSSKRGFLLYSSNRGGSLQVFRLDFRKDRHRQLTDARDLDPSCLALYGKDKRFAYIDGSTIFQGSAGGGRPRELYTAGDDWQLGEGLDIDAEGKEGVFVETRMNLSRLLLLDVKRRKATSVSEQEGLLTRPMLRPNHQDILYRRNGRELWAMDRDGNNRRKLNTAPGELGPVYWTSGARSFHYLSLPETRGKESIREFSIDQNEDNLIVETRQFQSFGPNGNSTAFIGARRAPVSPHIVLLLRIGRELTLCEHGASEEFPVTVVFSPDSRKIVFGSNRDGQPAIYTMPVDDLVEATDT